MTNPGGYTPDEIDRPAARSDNDVRLIKFAREEKPDIALVNFACHPDVIGKTKVSADWPGFVRRYVEEEHEDTHCIFMNGFQGDTNHYNFFVGKEGRGKGYKHSQKMGRVIADTVNLMWNETEAQDEYKIYAEMRTVFNKCSTRGEEHYAECKAFNDRYRAGDYSIKQTESGISLAEACRIAVIPEQPVYHKIPITVLGFGKIAFFGLGGEPFTEYGYIAREACRIATIPEQPVYRKFPITVLGLGKIAFYGLGGEPFTEYGYIAREAFPDKFILTTTCTNGGEGYFPSAQAFSQGGYEVVSSHFTDTLEKTITDASLEMLGKF